jgi:hypothetical protein
LILKTSQEPEAHEGEGDGEEDVDEDNSDNEDEDSSVNDEGVSTERGDNPSGGGNGPTNKNKDSSGLVTQT